MLRLFGDLPRILLVTTSRCSWLLATTALHNKRAVPQREYRLAEVRSRRWMAMTGLWRPPAGLAGFCFKDLISARKFVHLMHLGIILHIIYLAGVEDYIVKTIHLYKRT